MNVEQSSMFIVNRKELFNFENRQLPPPKNHPAAFSMKTIQIGTFLLLLLQPECLLLTGKNYLILKIDSYHHPKITQQLLV